METSAADQPAEEPGQPSTPGPAESGIPESQAAEHEAADTSPSSKPVLAASELRRAWEAAAAGSKPLSPRGYKSSPRTPTDKAHTLVAPLYAGPPLKKWTKQKQPGTSIDEGEEAPAAEAQAPADEMGAVSVVAAAELIEESTAESIEHSGAANSSAEASKLPVEADEKPKDAEETADAASPGGADTETAAAEVPAAKAPPEAEEAAAGDDKPQEAKQEEKEKEKEEEAEEEKVEGKDEDAKAEEKVAVEEQSSPAEAATETLKEEEKEGKEAKAVEEEVPQKISDAQLAVEGEKEKETEEEKEEKVTEEKETDVQDKADGGGEEVKEEEKEDEQVTHKESPVQDVAPAEEEPETTGKEAVAEDEEGLACTEDDPEPVQPAGDSLAADKAAEEASPEEASKAVEQPEAEAPTEQQAEETAEASAEPAAAEGAEAQQEQPDAREPLSAEDVAEAAAAAEPAEEEQTEISLAAEEKRGAEAETEPMEETDTSKQPEAEAEAEAQPEVAEAEAAQPEVAAAAEEKQLEAAATAEAAAATEATEQSPSAAAAAEEVPEATAPSPVAAAATAAAAAAAATSGASPDAQPEVKDTLEHDASMGTQDKMLLANNDVVEECPSPVSPSPDEAPRVPQSASPARVGEAAGTSPLYREPVTHDANAGCDIDEAVSRLQRGSSPGLGASSSSAARAPTAASAAEVNSRPEVKGTFRIQVPKEYPGVHYRRSKALEDKHPLHVPSGFVVEGFVEDNGEWLRVEDRSRGPLYLPFRVGSVHVLHKASPKELQAPALSRERAATQPLPPSPMVVAVEGAQQQTAAASMPSGNAPARRNAPSELRPQRAKDSSDFDPSLDEALPYERSWNLFCCTATPPPGRSSPRQDGNGPGQERRGNAPRRQEAKSWWANLLC